MQDERSNNVGHEPDHDGRMMGMMAVMMAICVGVLLLIAVLPALGFPLGLFVALGAGALVVLVHGKMMEHGNGR